VKEFNLVTDKYTQGGTGPGVLTLLRFELWAKIQQVRKHHPEIRLPIVKVVCKGDKTGPGRIWFDENKTMVVLKGKA